MKLTDTGRKQRWYFRVMLASALVLTMIGFIFVYSSSSVYAFHKCGDAAYYLKRQIGYAGLALVFFILSSVTPVRWFKRYAPWLFLVSLLCVAGTMISGLSVRIHASSRWLKILGVSFQPSEFLKITLVMYIAFLLDRKHDRLYSLVHSYIPFLVVLGSAFVLLLKQPDFGSVVTLFATTFILFFIAQVKGSFLMTTILAAGPLAAWAIFFRSYRLNRILVFLDPWKDPKGRGYQIVQSLIAIGSGGWWGVGIANSKQKFFYLPMQHTDFIVSIIAEETGFIGIVFLVVLYGLFCFVGLKVAQCFEKRFEFFTVVGFVILIVLQAAINLMVVSGMLPTKGLGLPFVSYGGSALLAQYIMLGIIANFIRNRQQDA